MSAATSKGHQRRTALLDAARRILFTSGGAELTMRAVADAAGVRLGHLQYYFPSRSDLLAALLERILADSLERIAALAPTTEGDGDADGTGGRCCRADPGPALESILADHDDPDLVRLFTEVWAMAAHDAQAAEAVTAFYAAYAAQLAAFIREHAPQTGPEDARSRAEVFVMLMEGAALFRSGIAGRPAAPTEALLRQVLLGLVAGADGD
ncbi:TetR/AcrR family transcriptional regulator [Streptomyces sp. WMMC940]|uniref:TetR/AcrR family transcriptional regulator n=1 Tax=Streptomyces sp. WMMC940 TaxID=3015153 RepID=UPI0022B678DD|nr:TetR family transcriptional regulator [Streptomyces sp. WMMC940]MCZ7462326.1 TetR family transcriptional regulator [Streptomyces sp. WMMC940]